MTTVTPGWKHVAIGFEGDEVVLDGLNPWQLEWHSLEEPEITVAHPSYPQQRHPMWIYELRGQGKTVKFAAGEFSNGVWGFYIPAQNYNG
jgi:hypothetical protein